MSRENSDCLKGERDICVKTIILSQNTAFMLPPALALAGFQTTRSRISLTWQLQKSASVFDLRVICTTIFFFFFHEKRFISYFEM